MNSQKESLSKKYTLNNCQCNTSIIFKIINLRLLRFERGSILKLGVRQMMEKEGVEHGRASRYITN